MKDTYCVYAELVKDILDENMRAMREKIAAEKENGVLAGKDKDVIGAMDEYTRKFRMAVYKVYDDMYLLMRR